MPFTVVQLSPTVNISAGTLTATLPNPTGTGNSLVACITGSGSTGVRVPSGLTLGGAADHWQAAYTDPTTTGFAGYIWYDPNCASGQVSVVLTASAGAGTGLTSYLTVYEVTGVLAFDKGSNGNSASSPAATWSSGATATTSQASEIFFGAVSSTLEVPTVTGAGSWTTQSTGAGTYDQAAGYQVVSSAGAATFSGTFSASGRAYAAVVATFMPAGVNTSPAYASNYDTTAVAGTGAWVSPVNATGAPDSSYATWTAP